MGWPLGYWGGPRPPPPPPIKSTFDGDPEKLMFFLNQIWSHLDQHGGAYIILANLEKEITKWVMTLHDRAPEVGDPDVFLRMLRAQFGDTTET